MNVPVIAQNATKETALIALVTTAIALTVTVNF